MSLDPRTVAVQGLVTPTGSGTLAMAATVAITFTLFTIDTPLRATVPFSFGFTARTPSAFSSAFRVDGQGVSSSLNWEPASSSNLQIQRADSNKFKVETLSSYLRKEETNSNPRFE